MCLRKVAGALTSANLHMHGAGAICSGTDTQMTQPNDWMCYSRMRAHKSSSSPAASTGRQAERSVCVCVCSHTCCVCESVNTHGSFSREASAKRHQHKGISKKKRASSAFNDANMATPQSMDCSECCPPCVPTPCEPAKIPQAKGVWANLNHCASKVRAAMRHSSSQQRSVHRRGVGCKASIWPEHAA